MPPNLMETFQLLKPFGVADKSIHRQLIDRGPYILSQPTQRFLMTFAEFVDLRAVGADHADGAIVPRNRNNEQGVKVQISDRRDKNMFLCDIGTQIGLAALRYPTSDALAELEPPVPLLGIE